MEDVKGSRTRRQRFQRKLCRLVIAGLCGLLAVPALAMVAHAAIPTAPTLADVIGEVERITINDPADFWSGGTIVIGGQNIILPRNLLMDFPANRLTLQQLFAQASPACVAKGETGLAKADACNTTGTGGIATVTANRTPASVIAGDVFIQKGAEAVPGVVTFIDFNDGYFRLNGNPNDPNTVPWPFTDPEAPRHYALRHVQSFNVLWCDGHAGSMTINDLQLSLFYAR